MLNSSARSLRDIYLIGFSGSGKTVVGRLLATNLSSVFYDTDQMIADREGSSIAEIFDIRGEEYFRRVESAVIRELVENKADDKVVALGGGTFENEFNRKLLLNSGLVIFLSCSVRTIYSRLKEGPDRPLLRVRPKDGETTRQARVRRIKQMLSQRSSHYALADIRLSTTQRTPQMAAMELSERIRRLRGKV